MDAEHFIVKHWGAQDKGLLPLAASQIQSPLY